MDIKTDVIENVETVELAPADTAGLHTHSFTTEGAAHTHTFSTGEVYQEDPADGEYVS